jgi:hypothetical protein
LSALAKKTNGLGDSAVHVSHRRVATWVAAAAIAWSALVLVPAEAAGPAGATFVDEAPLIATVSPGSQYTIPVDVLNGSATPVRLSLVVLDIQVSPDESAQPMSPTPGPDGVVAKSDLIPVGQIWKTALTLTIGAGSPGSYSGRLVVYADDGSIARRDFDITVKSPSLPSPCPTPAPPGSSSPAASTSSPPEGAGCLPTVPGTVLTQPFPSVITLAAERAPGGSGDSPRANFSVDPATALTLVPAALISDTGEVATMAIGPTGVVTLVGQGPGAYKGSLARAAVGDEKAPVALADLVLDVRDGPSLAIGLLLLGLLLAVLVEWLSTDWLPGRRLDARLAEVRTDAEGSATEDQETITRMGADWPGANAEPPRIEGDANALLSKAITIAEEDFDDSASLDVRTSRWGVAGSEFLKLIAFVASYREVVNLREWIADQWIVFARVIPSDQRPVLEASGLRHEISRSLAGSSIEDEPTLNGLKSALGELDGRMDQVVTVASVLTRMALLAPNAAYERELTDLWRRLATLESGSVGEIGQIQTDAIALRRAMLEPPTTHDVIERMSLLSQSLTQLPAVAAPRSPTRPLPDVAPLIRTPGELRDALRAWNWLFLAILVPVVVVVVLSTLYFGKTTFGTPADYAEVFVWGFVGTTGGTLVKLASGSFRFILPGR